VKYDKQKQLFNLVFVGESLRHKRYYKSKSSQPITWLIY